MRRFRLSVVAGLVLALLAFPCGPLATALDSDTGGAQAAQPLPAHAEHGDAECAHRATKHESSCCKGCSSWLTSRSDDGTATVLGHASQRDLPAVAQVYTRLDYVGPDQEQRLTGPPPRLSLYGTRLYSRTQRYRI